MFTRSYGRQLDLSDLSDHTDEVLVENVGASFRNVSVRRADFMDASVDDWFFRLDKWREWFFRLDKWRELHENQPWQGQFTRIGVHLLITFGVAGRGNLYFQV